MNLRQVGNYAKRMVVRLRDWLARALHCVRLVAQCQTARTEAPVRAPGGPPPRAGEQDYPIGSDSRSARGAAAESDRTDTLPTPRVTRFWDLRNRLKQRNQTDLLSVNDLQELARLADSLSLDVSVPAETQFMAIFTLGQVRAELGRRAQESWRRVELP